MPTHKAYNPFLSTQTSYRTVIESGTGSQNRSIVQPEVYMSPLSSRADSLKKTALVAVARPESPHLHSPFFSPYISTLNIEVEPASKLRKGGNMGGLGKKTSVRTLGRGSTEDERQFGSLNTALPALSVPPRHGGVMVTTEYEVESYRHSLGSTIRSTPLG